MADDGMLLNFEVGDSPFKPQIKFKGGRWRDRVRAQNSAKRQLSGEQHARESTRIDNGAANDGGSGRPPKRQRLGGAQDERLERTNAGLKRPVSAGNEPRGSSDGFRRGQNQTSKSHGIASSLFTSNPTSKTVFENPPLEDAEVAKPSNAPLSEEAANFHALGLSQRLAQHLSAKLEMKAPTAIQKNTIPQLVGDDSDAFLQAETGSGKTLAYLLPMVHRLMSLSLNDDGAMKDAKVHRGSGLFAIILAPTRELCKQIAAVLEKLLRCAPWIVSTTVIGGESKK